MIVTVVVGVGWGSVLGCFTGLVRPPDFTFGTADVAAVKLTTQVNANANTTLWTHNGDELLRVFVI